MPTLSSQYSIKNNVSSTRRREGLIISNAWPYWLGGPGGIDGRVVKNSFSMDGMFLLTGPNMAGKSTILRNTCAIALLGACGLAVPASPETTIPYIDAFMLRNFSSDSPLEGRSSFAVEMTEMKYVLQDVTSHSLVLVDELGKGTEARAGAALAGAMLESLDAAGCKGAFATHLHDLLRINLHLTENTRPMKMGIVVEIDPKSGEEYKRPTWQITPGSSTESLALDVARQCKLPQETVQRATELYNMLLEVQNDEIDTSNRPTSGPSEDFTVSSIDVDDDTSKTKVLTRDGENDLLPSIQSETLRKVATLLQYTSQHVLSNLQSTNTKATDDIAVRHVPAECLPGAHTVGLSCVYVACRPQDGRIYIGTSTQ